MCLYNREGVVAAAESRATKRSKDDDALGSEYSASIIAVVIDYAHASFPAWMWISVQPSVLSLCLAGFAFRVP